MPERPHVLARDDAAYPRRLESLRDPPRCLHVRGRIPAAPMVAIVGSRAATPYGRTQAATLARDLVRCGMTVVSGLARGIDAAAHEGALEAGGLTVAVLPGGLDDVAPRAHRALADRIAARGALLSEHPEGTALHRGMFVTRNRLIAALAGAVVVVEAAARSGALATAGYARDLARPVLAVPGDVDRPTSRGCHALLRDGARVCEGAGDVMAVLPAPDASADAAPGAALEGRVLAALGAAPRPVEQLARDVGAAVEDTLGALLRLEWAGVAASRPGQRWARVSR